jgi:L-threonylcarbamoyladenylate synthase
MTRAMPLASDPAAAVDAAADVLRAGGVIVIPTDTVYGLAALPDDEHAIARVFALKGRPDDVPIAVLCADTEQAFSLVDIGAGETADRIRYAAARGWPGPLTLVLPRRSGLVSAIGSARTVGVRCPDDPFVTALTQAVGPLATTSANRHGTATPSDAAAAAKQLGDAVDLVIDGGRRDAVASSVIDATAWPFRVLRSGALALSDLTE